MLNNYSTSDLSILIQKIKTDYEQLKRCEEPPIQKLIIDSILPKCNAALKILQFNPDRSGSLGKSKNIQNIIKKVKQINSNIEKTDKISQTIGHGGRLLCSDYSEACTGQSYNKETPSPQIRLAASRISRAIVMQEIKTADLKISEEQLQEILRKMENNQEIVKYTEQYIKSQGEKIDLIESDIQQVYKNAQDMNGLLDEASSLQMKSLKGVQNIFRTTASSIWGAFKWPFQLLFGQKN